MITTLPPNSCTICYQMYNNERSPLILIKCGHTFCKECLDIIMNYTKKEIICPECKQVTSISENPGKSLPKNRGLLNLIIYNEEVNKAISKEQKIDFSNKKTLNDNEKLFSDYEAALSKIEETYNKILEDHPFLIFISDVLIKKEVNESLEDFIQVITEYREQLHKRIDTEFEKINLIKSFRQSIDKYKNKFSEIVQKYNSSNKSLNCSTIENYTNKSTFSTNLTNFIEENYDNQNTINSLVNNINSKEYEELQREIKFIELYNLTLKNYSKDIYDPCKFFFQNKFQMDKLTEELKKLLVKVCDFDENVQTFNINKINNLDEKKLLKEIQETCSQSNSKKLQFIFSHFKLNPNFFYSDFLSYLTSNSTFADFTNINTGNIVNNINSNQVNNSNNIQRNTVNTNNNILRNFVGINSASRSSNPSQTYSGPKEKIINFHSFLKLFKDKAELSKMVNYLIEESNYLPLKFENDISVEVKFIKDLEWKLPLTII